MALPHPTVEEHRVPRRARSSPQKITQLDGDGDDRSGASPLIQPEDHQWRMALANIVVSVVLGIAAALAGQTIGAHW